MKKVVLLLAIAGLSICGGCYGNVINSFKGKSESVRRVAVNNCRNNDSNAKVSLDFGEYVKKNHDGVVDLRNISPWYLTKSYLHINYPRLEKKLYTAKVVSRLAVLGLVVGTVAYYTSPSVHGVVDYAWALPGTALNYVKLFPGALVSCFDSLQNPFLHMTWNVTKWSYHAGGKILSPIASVMNMSIMD